MCLYFCILQLKDLQDKYSECEDMLHEAQKDIKNLRNKSLPNSTVQRYTALASVLPMDSLAAEIEGTFRKGLDSPTPSEYKWVCHQNQQPLSPFVIVQEYKISLGLILVKMVDPNLIIFDWFIWVITFSFD